MWHCFCGLGFLCTQGFFIQTTYYADCESVLVLRRDSLPIFVPSSCIPYTYINRLIIEEVDGLTLTVVQKAGSLGVKNVPVPQTTHRSTGA